MHVPFLVLYATLVMRQINTDKRTWFLQYTAVGIAPNLYVYTVVAGCLYFVDFVLLESRNLYIQEDADQYTGCLSAKT
jgi:hypothetical protein